MDSRIVIDCLDFERFNYGRKKIFYFEKIYKKIFFYKDLYIVNLRIFLLYFFEKKKI